MIMALLLDLANIVGGFLLAIALLRRLPRVGDDLGRLAARVAPFGWIVGIVALVAAGYYLIVHLTSGPRVFHFEVVGLGVGIALLWDRLRGRGAPIEPDTASRGIASRGIASRGIAGRDTAGRDTASRDTASRDTASRDTAGRDTATREMATRDTATGVALLLAIFGIIAIVVGIQGLFTPD